MRHLRRCRGAHPEPMPLVGTSSHRPPPPRATENLGWRCPQASAHTGCPFQSALVCRPWGPLLAALSPRVARPFTHTQMRLQAAGAVPCMSHHACCSRVVQYLRVRRQRASMMHAQRGSMRSPFSSPVVDQHLPEHGLAILKHAAEVVCMHQGAVRKRAARPPPMQAVGQPGSASTGAGGSA
jgi:hypothetical protein